MKINSFKKKKLNMYELTLSNNERVILYDDIILKYDLLISKEIEYKELGKIIEENNKLQVYYEALKFISRKLRTEKEIRKKFQEFNKEAIDEAIQKLKKDGYINNEVYIKAYINDAVNLGIDGPFKITKDLINLGFNEIDILSYLDEISIDVWNNKITKYIEKKQKSNHSYSNNLLKQKIINDLINKGYSKEMISNILSSYSFPPNDDIYMKEYTKAKNKYSKKYSGNELELKVKNYLYQKGFRN